jgi:hypothetical protein
MNFPLPLIEPVSVHSRASESRAENSAKELGPRFHGTNGINRPGDLALEHDPEKWKPVFGKDHAQTKS